MQLVSGMLLSDSNTHTRKPHIRKSPDAKGRDSAWETKAPFSGKQHDDELTWQQAHP